MHGPTPHMNSATAAISARFKDLLAQIEAIQAAKRPEYNALLDRNQEEVDTGRLLKWRIQAKTLLERACGKESHHLAHFLEGEDLSWSTSIVIAARLTAVLQAAQEDFDGGHLTSMRSLVQAEVFASELDQANELHDSGYHRAAAVVGGTVLETTLRGLCDKLGIPLGKADRMNADLAKASAYNSLKAKEVTAMLAVRNAAAHGKTAEYSPADVRGMLDGVLRFVSEHVGAG